MAGVNKAIVLGNLGADPEIRIVANGNEQLKIASISIATTERYKDKTGNLVDRTEWHRVKLFRGLADIAENYLKKGGQVYVEGKLRTNKYTDNNNIERYTTEIIADNITLLGKRDSDEVNHSTTNSNSNGPSYDTKQTNQDSYSSSDSMADDDLPF